LGKNKSKLGIKKESEVQPISNPLNAVVADFKTHMKVTGVKLKTLTYDEVMEHLVDHCQDLLEKHSLSTPEASQS
jgi:uncharacterized membrane-anchored protein YhcB (DUF1043 family)